MVVHRLRRAVWIAAPPQTHRFDFVRNETLRPIVEEAFLDSGRALDEGDFERSLMTSCSVLEAIITDALEMHARLKPSRSSDVELSRASDAEPSRSSDVELSRASDAEPSRYTEMSFDGRIAAAERKNLIRGGCARLPAVARAYRDPHDAGRVVTVQDAKVTRQVLHVVMRDLDPGR